MFTQSNSFCLRTVFSGNVNEETDLELFQFSGTLSLLTELVG